MDEREILTPLEAVHELDAVLDRPRAMIYKHSPLCWQSFRAIGQVRSFALEHPEVPVFVVDVVGERTLSREVERRLRVRHESPQVLLLEDGRVVWHASHGGVREEELGRAATGPTS